MMMIEMMKSRGLWMAEESGVLAGVWNVASVSDSPVRRCTRLESMTKLRIVRAIQKYDTYFNKLLLSSFLIVLVTVRMPFQSLRRNAGRSVYVNAERGEVAPAHQFLVRHSNRVLRRTVFESKHVV